MHPSAPLPGRGDGYLYTMLLRVLSPLLMHVPVVYSLVAFLLVFTQATLLNRIVNTLRLFPKPHFLTGMSFLLVTSLMKEWTSFSAVLLVNSLMVWIWYRMIGLYNNSNPKTAVYDVAVWVGLLPLLYHPAIGFVLLLALALLITRPLRIAEWMVALLGLITPYYFLLAILFLNNQWHYSRLIPAVTFQLPSIPHSPPLIAGIVLLALPLLPGGYFVQDNLNKMLIQVRKAWSLLLSFLVVSLLILLFNKGDNYLHWMLVVVSLATFHAAFYFYVSNRWIALILHYVTFGFAILLNYGILH